jgi:hypothetical protein
MKIPTDLALSKGAAGGVFKEPDFHHRLIETEQGICVVLHLRLSFLSVIGRACCRRRRRFLPIPLFSGGCHRAASRFSVEHCAKHTFRPMPMTGPWADAGESREALLPDGHGPVS